MDRHNGRQRNDSTGLRDLDQLGSRSTLCSKNVNSASTRKVGAAYISSRVKDTRNGRELGDTQTGRIRGSGQSETGLDD